MFVLWAIHGMESAPRYSKMPKRSRISNVPKLLG